MRRASPGSRAVGPSTLAILSTLEFPAPHKALLVEQVNRTEYSRANSVLVAIGGAWSRQDQAHVWPDGSDARALVDAVITSGRVATIPDLGHFPTPQPLARVLVIWAEVCRGMRVLEPSAGDGAIVREIQDAGATVTAVELNPVRRQNLLLKVLSPYDRLEEACDLMTCEPRDAPFDRVVMNPPFLVSGAGDHLDHLRRAYGMLKPGGVLVSVMPSSLTFRRDHRYASVRAWCLERGTIMPLPSGSFRPSKTSVETVAVRLTAQQSRKIR